MVCLPGDSRVSIRTGRGRRVSAGSAAKSGAAADKVPTRKSDAWATRPWAAVEAVKVES